MKRKKRIIVGLCFVCIFLINILIVSGLYTSVAPDNVESFENSENVKDIEIVKILEEPFERGIRSMRFSQNGQWLASGTLDNRHTGSSIVQIFETNQWSNLVNLTDVHGNVESVHFSPDDEYLYVCVEDNPGMYIYKTKDWSLERVLGGTGKWCLAMHASDNGEWLAYGGSSTDLLVVEVGNWDEIIFNRSNYSDHVFEMMFSEDNTKLFMGLHNGNFYVYDTKNWKEVAHWKKNGQVNSICLDNKNEYLFLGGEGDDGLKRINMNKIEQEELNYSEDSRLITSERVFDCEVSDDNHLLGAVSGSGLWLYYNNDNFTKIFNESYKNWGQAVDMSSDLNLLAAGLYNGSIIIYDISSLKDEDRKLYLTGRSIGQRVVYSKLDYLLSNMKYIISGFLLLCVVSYSLYRIKRKRHDESLKE